MNIKRISQLLSRFVFSFVLLQGALAFADPGATPEAAAESPEMTALKDALRAQNWTKAAELGEVYVKAHPDDVMGWNYLGVSYTNLDKLDRALDCFETENAKGSTSQDNLRSRALLSVELKRPNALKLILEAADAMPNEAYLQFMAAQQLNSAKRETEAVLYYEKAATMEPMNSAYVVALATRYDKRRNFEQAILVTKKAIDAGNKDVTLYINNCVYCFKSKKYEDVITWADQGWSVKTDPLLMYHKARALVHLGRYAEAEAVIRDMTASHFGTKIYLAMALMGQGCNIETFKTCTGSTPDACCAREKEALEIYADIEALVDDKRKEDYIVNYSVAMAIAGKSAAAESLLKTSSVEEGKVLALEYVIMAINASWQGAVDGKPVVNDSVLRLYRQAKSALADMGAESFGVKFIWPTRALETLDIIKSAEASANDNAQVPTAKKNRSSCGCDLNSSSPANAPLAALALSLLGIGVMRKKEN